MTLRALAALCALTGLTAPAAAEPCALFLLEDRPLREKVTASPEGGIVVGQIPTPAKPDGVRYGRERWSLRVKGKPVAPKADEIAPGLVVLRPPAGARAWDLVDESKKRRAVATLAQGKDPALLEAPPATRVTSGTTESRHPNTFVTVELSSPVPKDAIALVLAKAKGPAYSWGVASTGATSVDVFSTGGGCIAAQSNGSKQAAPGETVTLFWVDQYGRRSRATPPLVVEKP